MRTFAMPLAVVGSLLVVAVVLMTFGPPRESQHDKDLRDCIERYGVSRYAEPEMRAFQSGMVAACMRGRGY